MVRELASISCAHNLTKSIVLSNYDQEVTIDGLMAEKGGWGQSLMPVYYLVHAGIISSKQERSLSRRQIENEDTW